MCDRVPSRHNVRAPISYNEKADGATGCSENSADQIPFPWCSPEWAEPQWNDPIRPGEVVILDDEDVPRDVPRDAVLYPPGWSVGFRGDRVRRPKPDPIPDDVWRAAAAERVARQLRRKGGGR